MAVKINMEYMGSKELRKTPETGERENTRDNGIDRRCGMGERGSPPYNMLTACGLDLRTTRSFVLQSR